MTKIIKNVPAELVSEFSEAFDSPELSLAVSNGECEKVEDLLYSHAEGWPIDEKQSVVIRKWQALEKETAS